MLQGMILINEEGYFEIEGKILDELGIEINIFDEETQQWNKGTLQQDEFKEYYFTNGFLVEYLYEGMPIKIEG